ncbi:serine hydrolase domain-containing protein [Winogradskyella haliclonae]|uniref:Serine hydrolase n=1 Tax=Winogradskyella haliclonae TaxID=2048558 RepID=A0ABQ2BYK5_9FLAO|nr:serine hydrolase [Winogradskyella haliclonae]GGI57587.1 serine hydrolase [Winogradskyella haliclonae]
MKHKSNMFLEQIKNAYLMKFNLKVRVIKGISICTVSILFICCAIIDNHSVDVDYNGRLSSNNKYLEAHKQNFDTIKLQSLVSKIDNGYFGDVHSIIISRKNEVVLEKYFRGYDRDRLHCIYSITKSVTSALIGIAIDSNDINDLDEELLDFFPEYSQIENLSNEKENITLENILTMSSGFEWNEWTYPYDNPNNSATILWESNDMIKYMLNLPLSHNPGTHFTYNSGCSILLSGIIKNKTGLSAEQYAANNLFSKVGIEEWNWLRGDDGLTWTSGELFLRPIDMLKFGELYLNNGHWNDLQIISEDWIETSTSSQIRITDNNNYGYHWWRYSENHYVYNTLGTKDIYYAIGHAGQYIWVIPHLDMVIVTTAGNEAVTRKSESMLWGDILPSILN